MIHASLFSGIGGPEIAAAMLGWENAFHCEINPFGRAILNYWFPNSISYEDITQTDFREWRGRIDVLTGGFPCQPFSYAGKRRGRNDERYLWPQMLRVIDEIRLTWVVGENVGGIATMVENGVCTEMGCDSSLFGTDNDIYRYELRESFTLEQIGKDLESIRYEIQSFLIPAAAVGAPHRRDRIFIVASNADRNGLHGNHKQDERKGYIDRNETRITPEDTNGVGFRGKSWIYGGKRFVTDPGMLPGERWERFPTVSPVHRGNDGFPFNVDDLTIPFKEWHDESLKAYGNAIVPQVMYEIFLAIEQVSKK